MFDIVLVRHGETEWSRTGQHTGRADVPLTEDGRATAAALGVALADRPYAVVLTSPLSRARDTCALAGFGEVATVDDDLQEWDYGEDEGRTTDDIRHEIADWTVWSPGPRGGETVNDVARRADRVIARCENASGDVLLFGHGHMLRVLAASWLDLRPTDGRLLALDPGSVSVLGYERDQRVLQSWNVLRT